MQALNQEVIEAWENREGAIVLTTISPEGIPNAIYAGCVYLHENKQIVVADNYFNKTKQNIENGSKGSILFLTKERKSYQLKGTFSYHHQGPLYEEMKRINPPQHPGHAAVALHIEEVYKGAERLN
ncbi:hypothetical protein LX69_00480 [Breznakibacter xylanolyticus]|uniref:Pyridoxamine 5'-phosphate oxidase N-terminal domain-containing protein n=1 Tax=Breznakibacter xylanolyticus TaxID=990 RepID=A0A2W7QDT7_9BACT|nr:pyridoxamine 5'-phosphate oxidase family protein [Breznakibacter xylanolyticus]PZX20029.1 hypothetical protein LX69_00480 [Breznakibacter xylanolyticus]